MGASAIAQKLGIGRASVYRLWMLIASRCKVIPADSLLQLRQRLDRLPPKSPERAAQIASIADLYGVT